MSQIDPLHVDQAGFVLLRSLPVEPTVEDGVASRVLFQSPELRLSLLSFEAGQELVTHKNHRRVIIEVLEGRGEFLYEGRWQLLDAGALLHLPPSREHAVRASDGPFRMLLTLVG